MNRQPYGTPPQWWAPKLSPRVVRWSRGYRWRQLHHHQRIAEVVTVGEHHLVEAVRNGHGVLLTPNHSAHYDSAALYIAADRFDLPLYFMTAWQVFHMSSRWECWLMQKLGCFSIDREANDRQAFKQAVEIVSRQPHPLVIFPEGDIYHTTDYITPFREGAAAIALSAAKRAERPTVAIPCGIKFWYVDNPTGELAETIAHMEQRLYLRPLLTATLTERIHRLAEAALALKELDYLGFTKSGRVRDRIRALSDAVLAELETRYQLNNRHPRTPPERVKTLRQAVIEAANRERERGELAKLNQRQQDMDDLFFVLQLFSYRGDYLLDQPSLERLAETVDKFEEDILERDLPSVRGRRRVVIQFGAPIAIEPRRGRAAVNQLTQALEDGVQGLLDTLNQEPPSPSSDGGKSATLNP